MNTVATLLMMVTAAICQFDIMLNTSFFCLFLLFFLFGLAMTSLACLVSVFIGQARTATIIGFLVFVIGFILMNMFASPSAIYDWFDPDITAIPRYLFIILFPPFSFAKGFHDIARLSGKAVAINGELVPGPGFDYKGVQGIAALGSFGLG